MKLIDLGENVFYRWRVEIPSSNKNLVCDVTDWINVNKIQATLVPGLAFFQKEKDVILFIMKWL